MNNKTIDIFEIASREKYRYPYKGMITTEDLWDLSLEELDAVFKTLNKTVMAAQTEDSLMYKPDDIDNELLTKIRIVRHVFNTKETEQAICLQKKANADKKQKILAVLAQRESDSLNNMTDEELQNLLNELG